MLKNFLSSKFFLLFFFSISVGCASLKRNTDDRGPAATPETKRPDDATVLSPTSGAPEVSEADDATVAVLGIADKDGDSEIQVTYSYSGTLKYNLKFATLLSDADFAQMPAKVKYAFYQSDAADYVMDWTEIDRDSVRRGDITITDQKTLKQILPFQTKVDLIIGIPNSTGEIIPRYSVLLGALCQQLDIKFFKNETDPAKRCADVTEADVKAKAPDAYK